ncbi:molybdenum cofactor sulfurase [Drosophila eugracilis]|uniref:molybdenum cofactor sulfurase n=1 Tax=Drosophila eugracilis TaxID=29029 RepID=UPI0007E6920C|nr:molybdenum cofactor sulfurase [Drosophila eugracilis]
MSSYHPEFSASEQSKIDAEFSRLAKNRSVYLDHAGTTLYAENQVKATAEELQRNVFCNPHTCRLTGDFVDQVRFKVLEFFNTTAEDYHVIFTANATAALSLVADNFDFGSSGDFHFCQENHTSVLGMRERVQANGIYMLRENEISGRLAKENGVRKQSEKTGNSLVTFSAQCNFSGYKIPLDAIGSIQNGGLSKPGKQIWGSRREKEESTQNDYYICLDAASFVATSPLDLQKYRPDYVCLSFYKIFGYPTGVGALLVSRRGAEAFGKRRFFGGGTINYAYPHAMDHQLRESFHQRYEDGTLPFLAIVGLLEGFRTLERLVPKTGEYGTMERISRHVFGLARYLENELKQLKHPNGEPLIQLYNKVGYQDKSRQGGIVAFNVRTESGSFVGFGEIACVAALHGILLRTGCFCNIGACQFYLNLDEDAMDAIYKRAGRICGDYFDLIDGQPTGAVRVSFGYMTTIRDVEEFLKMLRSSYLATKPQQRIQFIEDQAEQLPPLLKERVQLLRPKLLQMAIFPVKSCAAFKIETQGSWPLTDQGLKYDREWMIVDMNGMALTQKRCTELCLIKPVIRSNQLELRFGDDSSVSVPLSLEDQAADSAKCVSKVCRQPVEGLDCGDEVAQWLSQNLGLEGLRLLRQSGQRNSSKDQQKLSLVNQAQFLLLNKSSVRSLQFEEPLDETVDRFRANIIIDTGCAFEELAYKALSIGGIHFQVEGPCQRCDMICINQRTGERSPETLTTISRLQKGRMRFGIYITRIPQDTNNLEGKDQHMTCGDIVLVE